MPIELKMPALSPTMEEGTLAKWLVKEGDTVAAGDLIAEIETDKATMEFEAVDEGVVSKIVVPEGSEGVKVGAVIAIIAEEGEDASASPKPEPEVAKKADKAVPSGGGETGAGQPATTPTPEPEVRGYGANPAEDKQVAAAQGSAGGEGDRVKASPLARRLAEAKGIDLGSIRGSGPGGRIVKADIDGASSATRHPGEGRGPAPAPSLDPGLRRDDDKQSPAAPKPVWFDETIPHTEDKLSNIRKTIARRLTEAKQTIPHIYLTVDIRLDALLKLRGELNASLSGRGVKLSVNDLLIKALGVALETAPKCNVTFRGDTLVSYQRADVSVAVSTPTGLITPIIRDAASIGVAKISAQMKELAGRAKEGKLQPHEYQGGTASLSNMGMYGIKQFEAVINPPQAMIMAIGAGEKRPYIVDDALGVATVMSATGSFDHRAIDGADGAELMKIFKELVESPMGLVA